MDFFSQVSQYGGTLNQSERKLLEFIVKNSRDVKDMSIRELSSACYVSTTTILRFVRKLGFSGYREFSESMRFSYSRTRDDRIPDVIWEGRYATEYVKNLAESIRVLSKETVSRLCAAMRPEAHVWCVGEGLDREPAHYAFRMMSALGYEASCPADELELATAARRFGKDDVALVFSISGESPLAVGFMQTVQSAIDDPVIATFTQSANNTIQALSSYDFYVFSEHIVLDGIDFSSRVSMMAIVDLICYELLGERRGSR